MLIFDFKSQYSIYYPKKSNEEKKPLKTRLNQFKELREKNLKLLSSKNLTEDILNKTGIHPEFGEVTLKQLLATWAAHDLGHIAQISRVMAKQYKYDVGPWIKYLRILNS